MTVVVWLFALLTAAIHIMVFTWEALLLKRPAIHRGVFGMHSEDVPAVRLWAFGVGFYNLFLGCGLIIGVVQWAIGSETVGRTLVTYICWVVFLAGIQLLIADRIGLYRERGKGVIGAIGQSTPPLIALVAMLFT
jgi:putative membrane protein